MQNGNAPVENEFNWRVIRRVILFCSFDRRFDKNYRAVKALNSVPIHALKGAIYGFVERNGVGKTTLFRIICGMPAPASRTYTLCGAEVFQLFFAAVPREAPPQMCVPTVLSQLQAQQRGLLLEARHRVRCRESTLARLCGICV